MLTKEIVEKELREVLLNELQGKNFDTYKAGRIASDWLKEKMNYQDYISYNTDKATVTICIYPNHTKYSILEIKCKKVKGDYHHSWLGGSYYDWSFKDFEITLFADSVEQRLEEINNSINYKNNKEAQQKKEALEVIDLIKKQFPNKSEYDIRNLIDYIKDNKYNLF